MAEDINELKTQIRELKKQLKATQANEQKEKNQVINAERALKELRLKTDERADPKLRNLNWFIDQYLYTLSSYDQLNKDSFKSIINAFSYIAWAYLKTDDGNNENMPSLSDDEE